jgi:hypothetical protein
MDIRIPKRFARDQAEAILARESAELFAAANEVPCVAELREYSDDPEQAAHDLLTENGASLEAIAACFAAMKAERTALRAAYNPTGPRATFEEQRDAWEAWEAACEAFNALS